MLADDQRVVWWRGPSRGRLTAVAATVLGMKGDKVRIQLDDGAVRCVPVDRVQPVKKWYLSHVAPGHVEFEPPLDSWGRCSIHIEIDDDLFPSRYVYQFQGGRSLCYDRSHWIDNYGQLGSLAFCKSLWCKRWKGASLITANEFEEIWEAAQRIDHQVAKLDRTVPGELAKAAPWKRRPIQVAGINPA